jgi:hypothetical protein
MPRMILRIMTATMVMCMVCLNPTQTSAEHLSGPIIDPIIVNEADEYISLTCPMPITISCETNGIYLTFAEFQAAGGSVALPDGCEEDSVELTFVADNIVSQTGCNFVYMREYLLTADCDNTFTCNQLVIQNDNDNPTIECAQDTLLMMDNSGGPCLVAYLVPDITAMDGCDLDVMVTNDSPGVFGVGPTVITYTATDDCGNTSQCSFTVTVTDNNTLDVSCATDTVVNYVCDIAEFLPYADFAAFMADGGSVSENCSSMGGTFMITNVTTSLPLGTCPLIYNRTYTITDDNSNTGACTQMISIVDESKPTFTEPGDITVDCSMTQDTSVTGTPTNVMDNCDTMPTVTWFDKDTMPLFMTCTGEISFTRSWIVTDNCMNADTLEQTITTLDTIAPTVVCLDTIILYLDNLGFAFFDADTLDNGSTDNCSELLFSTEPLITFIDCSQAVDTTTVNLIVSDGCGNSNSCQVSIVVLDTFSIILTSPTNDTVTMATIPDTLTTINEYENAGGTINDNCTGNYQLTVIDTDTIAICQLEIIRTYQYTDGSGNSDTATHIIIVTDGTGLADNEAPVITNVNPQFVALKHFDNCTFDTTFTLPTATDDYMIDTTYFSISTFVNDTAIVTFVAEDVCGNVTDTIFDLILLDPTSPDILIDDITIMCDLMVEAPIYTTVQEFLAGPGAYVYDCRLDSISFTHMGDVTQLDGTMKRTYLINDFAGNTGTEVQNITIADITEPEFTFCPASFEVQSTTGCSAIVDVPTPVYNDNCNGSLALTHNSLFGTSSDDADGVYPVGDTEVSYFLEDGSGLKDTCTFTITVTDNIDPVIVCPLDQNVDCSIDNYIPATDSTSFVALGGTLSDGCGINAVSSVTSAVPATTDQFMVTYTAIDVNGNSNMCSHIVTVIDTISPVLDCVSSILVSAPTNSCDTLITIIAPTATDNCGVIDTIYNNLTLSDNATMAYTGTTTIKWYAIDAAGNMDSCTYDIIVADGIGPVLEEPNTVNVMCIEMVADVDTFLTTQDLIDAGGLAYDNCGIETFQIISETNVGDSIVRREYEAIDTTGNSTTVFQTIIIDDTTAPSFDAPVDVTIDCSIALDSLEILGTVDSTLFMDNCGEIDTLIYSDITLSTGGCLANDSIQRIWILTDESGNESRDTQYITRIDTTGPVFYMALVAINDISCSDILPATQILTATDNCSGAIVTTDTIPPVDPTNLCMDYEITYRYTAMDNCGNITRDSVSFMRLGDTQPPILAGNPQQILNTSLDTCGVLVTNVPKPQIISDDCSNSSTFTSDFTFDLYPIGTTDVTWAVQNECGLTSFFFQKIIVEDNVPPVIVCQDLNVSLGGDGFAIVQADTLAKSITDNCDHYFGNSTKVRRLDGPTECTNDGTFSNSVTFCCDDVGKTILVEVQVTDDSGNVNTCTSEITINNAQGINLIQGPPNIDISCEFQFDPEDLSIFGSYVTAIEDQEDIRIEDHFYQFDSIAGQDGLYINTCGLTTITETSEELSGSCGRDTIIRYFKFKNGDDSLTVQQFIYRHDVNKFKGSDIEWPAHFTWNQCANPAPDTSISGAPIIINNDYCSQVAVSFKDQLFNYPLTSCPVVKRKWKIIDWCQYNNDNDPANNPGLWTYNQFINVENDVPATILSACNDTLICAPGDACEATVSLSITAEDDCMADAQNLYYKYRIDIGNDNNNANDITGTTASFSHQVEAGIHKVKWLVEDRCGNVNQECEYLITVKECKDPTPVCHDGLAIDLAGNQSVELWASDINQSSSDNCTPNSQLSISFSSDPTDNLITFTCANIGDNEVDMWVTDLAGNQSYCTATINVQDNLGGCSTQSPNIQGKIATENNVAIPEAMVSILGAEMDNEIMTENDGVYTFGDLDMQNDYQILVDRDKDYLDGVTTLDLVMIQRHILGLSELDSPYKLIAADINNSESLTATDLLALRKLILGIDLTLDQNTSWRFVSKNESMNDMTDPWPFTEDLILQSESTQSIDADFIGVKIGDVNNSSEGLLGAESIEKRSSNTLEIITHDRKIRRDDQIYIDLVSSSTVDLEAMQMTITWDADAMTLIDIVPIGIDMKDYHSSVTNSGQLTIAWHNVDGKKVSEGAPFFQLVMEGNKTARLSNILEINSNITSAIAYNMTDESMDIDLKFEDAETFGIIFGQNKPNPFLSETTVEFSLPEAMEVTFKVFAGSGKMIHKTTNNYTEGSNTLKLGEQLGEYRGLLFLKMETAEFSEVKRMIRIE